MPRLLHDRYVAYDDLHGCDLATGDEVRLDGLPQDGPADTVPALAEVLDNARDGDPRWIVADVRSRAQVAAIGRRAAAAGRQRGFIPMLVSLYARLREALAVDLAERTLLLLANGDTDAACARSVFVDAAARSPRPHVLLTFQTVRETPRTCIVHEARAAYGAVAGVPQRVVPLGSDAARHLERAARASDFQRAGRHAAAERLLREVAAMLARREAWQPAADVLVRLGRLLLERGRAAAAESIFAEAAQTAQTAGDERQMLGARLWQVAARTDGGRLTDAESLCRAALLTRQLTDVQKAWGEALLLRILCWQNRLDEALRSVTPSSQWVGPVTDPFVSASIDAIVVRLLLASGDIFAAGQRARQLVTHARTTSDPLARAVAATAHLRVLSASGDLHLAEQQLHEACTLSREARAPLRAIRARLVWHDALRHAGRSREADRHLTRLARLRGVAPPLLRAAISSRLGAAESVTKAWSTPRDAPAHVTSPGDLVHLVHEEERDASAIGLLVGRLARDLAASRVEIVSADAGPVSVLMGAGTGLATEIGQRVLEAGILISTDTDRGGRELGVPVRCGSHLVAALVSRWPVDREPPARAAEVLGLAAAIAAPRVETLVSRSREVAHASTAVPELIGASPGMSEVRRAIERAARAPFAVLIEGESGVGKELAARAIHQLSVRRERRFCDVNCAALPDELLESELFGHARGAFTGALTDKPGLVEEADGGTLFLDEVADLSPRGQAKLLRVVQQQEVRRVGETFARTVDVRLVTAANRDMRREAAEHRFRADLLYRLDVIHIRIPPLRERPEDIPVLAQHFWQRAAARVESRAALTHGVLAELARHPWPGNARELQNVMAALAVAGPARGRICASLLPVALTGTMPSASPGTLAEARTQFERRFIELALARANGSRTRAAAALGLSRQGLLKTMGRLGIIAPEAGSVTGGGS